MQLNSSVRLSFAFVLAAFVLLTGCDGGPPYYSVEGTVRFAKDNSIASFGIIEFRSESSPPVTARSSIQKDGSFLLTSSSQSGTVGGWHTVVVVMPIGDFGPKFKHKHGLESAKKYLDHRTTDLRVEVTENVYDLELKIDELIIKK